MLSSTASALLCLVGHVYGSDSHKEPQCGLNLLQYAAESELEPEAGSGRAACKGWCIGNSFDWQGKCGWAACAGCEACDTLTAQPTPAPSPTADNPGCKQFCAAQTYKWESKCTWNTCNACPECATESPTASPTESPTASPTECYNKAMCRDIGHDCCGLDILTMSCAEGYHPEVTGTCGLIGAQKSYTCKLNEYDDSMCDGILGDKCCGIQGVSVNCKYGYEAVPTGTCGLLGARTKFTCRRPELDDSKCDSYLGDACCGISGVTVKCKDGYEVVETGECGLIDARTKYSCRAKCDA
jgi:hypothetical protein